MLFHKTPFESKSAESNNIGSKKPERLQDPILIQLLKLRDLILIENAEIEFGSGLNIFTGETGSGKSAILTAIRLVAGERADAEWIRSGAAIGIAEVKLASFPKELLGEIDPPPPGEPLTVRREIHRSGKSRCFIEDHLVNAGVLRELMHPLLEMVDQSSSGTLCLQEKQRSILDTYAGLEQESAMISDAFKEMSAVKKELESTIASEMNRSRDLEWAESSLRDIEEANWHKKEEEESLNQSHLFLTHTQELTENIAGATEGLSSLAPRIRHLAHLLDRAAILDSLLRPCTETIKTAALELDEAEHFLRSYASRLEADPGKLALIESRIAAIETLKRRFGPSWEDVQTNKAKFAAEIDRFASLDEKRMALSNQLKQLEEQTAAAAKRLSEKRQIAAKMLKQAVEDELKCLNLPHAKFELQITPKLLSSNGIDEIRFLFTANPGLNPLPLEQCASGGELSRLFFAIKVVLSEKESVHCLIFDEIDSNVGGQTAAVLGQKLKDLSTKRQVLCVTHFVQVARFATHHFTVAKRERDGRAATFVEKLEPHQREREYARMIGYSQAT